MKVQRKACAVHAPTKFDLETDAPLCSTVFLCQIVINILNIILALILSVDAVSLSLGRSAQSSSTAVSQNAIEEQIPFCVRLPRYDSSGPVGKKTGGG